MTKNCNRCVGVGGLIRGLKHSFFQKRMLIIPIDSKKFVLASSLNDENIINRLQEISNQQIKLKEDLGIKQNQELTPAAYKDNDMETVLKNNLETDEKASLQEKTEETEKTNVSLSLSEISLTSYCTPGIYAIENKVNNTVYVGEADHLINRLRRHNADLRWGLKSPILLQKGWNKFGASNFSFTILQNQGSYLETKKDRVYYQNRYIVEYVREGKNIYNLINSDKTINEVINVIKNIEKLKQNELQPINKNVDFLFQPGVYSFKNLRGSARAENGKRYIGQSNSLIDRVFQNIMSLKAGDFSDQPEFQNDWSSNKGKNFEISVLECGSKVNLNNIKRAYERAYINYYSPNVYNKPRDAKKLIESGEWKRRDWNRVPVYIKNDNNYKLYDSVLQASFARTMYDKRRDHVFNFIKNMGAVKDTGISEPLFRNYLNDPTNSDYLYGRSCGRYFNSGRMRLIVGNLNRVYLNLFQASYEGKISNTSLKKRLKDKNNFEYTYFDELTPEQKKSIPNLKKQIRKELRRVIPLPLDPNNDIENEVLNRQSPIYSKSTQEVLLSEISKTVKNQMQEQWKELVTEYFIFKRKFDIIKKIKYN